VNKADSQRNGHADLDSAMEAKSSVNDVLRCSFCNKAQSDVRRLIAGPVANICDECVEVCVDVIVDGTKAETAEAQRWHSIAAKLTGEPGVCSLCGKPAFSQHLLPIEGRGVLCGECADAIEDTIARGRPIL
jgi:ClpX C4-type zinc finger